MTYDELLERTAINSLSEVNRKAYCIVNKAFVDQSLIKAYCIVCIFSKFISNVTEEEEIKIFGFVDSFENEQQNDIKEHIQGIIRRLDIYDVQLSDIEKIIEVTSISNDVIGDVSEEVIRAFILHAEVDEEFVKSDTDKQLSIYSKIFSIHDINLIEYARANRVKWLERFTDGIYCKGDISLLDQMRPIQEAIFDWR